MSQEIGTAYVTVLPSTKGLGRQIERDIDGGVASGTKKGGSSFISGVGKWVGRATIAGAAIAGAFTIKGGISRLMAIDDAQGKLKGLGFSTEEIAAVMDNALASVKGTAFGLGDAATAAAGAIASGIKPGKDLENYLKLVGDAATIAGTDFNEMGAIFGKVTAKNKVGMEEINQLSERGVPIMQWLADQYGVTGDEMSKMVSQGKVSAKDFQKAIKDNIGGAALESGKTARGAIDNLLASLGRIGANLLGPIFEGVAPGARSLTDALAPLEDIARNVGEALKSGLGWVVDNAGPIGAFAGVILAVAAALKVWAIAQALLNAVMAASPLTWIVLGIAALVAGLVYAYQNFETFRNVVDTVFGFIKTVVGAVVSWFTETAMPYIQAGWAIAVQAFQAAWAAIQPVLNVIKTVIEFVFNGIKAYFTVMFNIYKTIFSVAFNLIKTVVTTVFNQVRTVIQVVMTVVSTVIRTQIAIWRTAFNVVRTVISAVIGFFQNLVAGVRQKVSAVVGVITGIKDRVVGFFTGAVGWLINAGKQIIQGLVDGIRNMFDTVKNTLGELTSKLTDWKGPPKKDRVLLRGAGQLIIQGLVDGIRSGESGLKGYLERMTKAIGKALSLKQISKAQAKQMTTLVEQTGKGLAAIARKVEAHQEKLKELVEGRASLKSQIADSLTGELDLGSLVQDGKTLTFEGVSSFVANTANRIRAFAGKISELIRKGIPLGLVQEVAGLGSEKGTAVANALLSGTSQQVADLTNSYAGVSSAASAVGEAIAAKMYDAGIQAQQGLIDGLLNDKGIKDAAAKLAKGLTKAVRKELGIKSPSRVMRDKIGKFLLPGASAGVDATLPAFRSHIADALNISDLVQPLNVPSVATAGSPHSATGRPIEIHQHAVPYIPTEKQMMKAWRDMENLYGVGA
ncbi:MAG: tape measure protein [Candidatus Nanopelagicales bacterium]